MFPVPGKYDDDDAVDDDNDEYAVDVYDNVDDDDLGCCQWGILGGRGHQTKLHSGSDAAPH